MAIPSKIIIPMHSKHGNKKFRHTLTFFDKTNQTPSTTTRKTNGGRARGFYSDAPFPAKTSRKAPRLLQRKRP